MKYRLFLNEPGYQVTDFAVWKWGSQPNESTNPIVLLVDISKKTHMHTARFVAA